jgi:hypothetical protein
MPNENQQPSDESPPAMGEFNAYREWLGVTIPAPNYYELLGLPDEEPDVTRIASAADRAIARVRSHRPGERAKQWSHVLDELKSIKQTLTRLETKQEYDATLGSQKKKGAGKGAGKPRRPSPLAQHPPRNPAPPNGPGQELEGMSLDAMGLPSLDSPNAARDPSPKEKSGPPARVDEGLDLSYLNSPPSKSPPAKSVRKPAPPLAGEQFTDAGDPFEQVDDIVLPPAIQPATSDSHDQVPSEQPLPAPVLGNLPKASRVRANPMLAARRKRQGAWRTRVMSGLMSGLLIALGIYAFIFFEDPNGNNPLGDGFPEMAPRESLLSDEQRAAILAESERRSQQSDETSDSDSESSTPVTEESRAESSPDDESTVASANGGDQQAPEDQKTPEAMDLSSTEQADIFPDNSATPENDLTESSQPTTDEPQADRDTELNPADREQLQNHLKAIRLALSEQRLDEIEGLLEQARPLAQDPDDSAKLDSFQQAAGLLAEFQTAVKRAMASMDAGTSFPISATSEVVVVERLPDAIRIRLAGQNHLFPLNDLPLMLGRALAERGMPSGPHAQAVLGTFQAVHKRARPEHLDEVRRWWQEAQEEGEDVEKLFLLLD